MTKKEKAEFKAKVRSLVANPAFDVIRYILWESDQIALEDIRSLEDYQTEPAREVVRGNERIRNMIRAAGEYDKKEDPFNAR